MILPEYPETKQTIISVAEETPTAQNEIRVSNDNSYLGMWKNAVDCERKTQEFQEISNNSFAATARKVDDDSPDALEHKYYSFKKILKVPKDERDQAQQMQVIDRAAAAQTLLEENPQEKAAMDVDLGFFLWA